MSSRRIFAEFSVDSPQTVTYVGTLKLARSSTSVEDDFAIAAQAFKARFPSLQANPVSQLLKLEKEK